MMGHIPTHGEFREIIESEHVSWDQKKQIVKDYFDYLEDRDDEELYRLGYDSEDRVDELMDKYHNEYGLTDDDDDWTDGGDIDEEYAEAKKTHDAGVAKGQHREAEEIQSQRDEAKEQLVELKKKRSETDPGVANSSEILDTGLSGAIRGLERFYPAYNRAVQDVAPTEFGPVNYERDILQRYNEQRGIPFDTFKEQAADIDNLREGVIDSLSNQSNRLATVFSHWNGDGAQSARSLWEQVREISRTEVKDGLTESSEAILRACSAVAAACQRKAGWSLNFAIPNWCGLQPYEVDLAINIATQGVNASDGDIKHFIDYMPEEHRATIDDDKGSLEEETKKAAQQWATEWLRDFTRSFAKFVSDFHVMCDNEKNATDEAWGSLTQFLNGLPEDPYSAVAAHSAAPAAAPVAAAGGASGSAGGAPSVGGGGASVGGGGAAGLGAAPSGALGGAPGGADGVAGMATPTMPSMPKPDMGAATGQDPVNPVTGSPLDVDPKTGSPYPIDPATGEVVKDAAPDVDTVTVRQGENEIALTEPNRDGVMSVRIDDGNGKPAEYTLDFGAGGTSGGEHAASGFGPTGGANGVPGGAAAMAGGGGAPGAANVYTPSEDGTIQIHNREVSIVAEQPLGPDGATVVTVDTGSGEPETYVMGDENAVREYNDRMTTSAFGAPPQAGGEAAPQFGGAAPQAEPGTPPQVGGFTPPQPDVAPASADQPGSGRVDTEPQESGAVRPASVSAGDSGVASVGGAFTEPAEPAGARGSLDGLDGVNGVGAGISGSTGGDPPRGVGGSLGAELGEGPNAGHSEGIPGRAEGSAGIAGGAAGFADGADNAAFGGDHPNGGPPAERPQDDGPRSGAMPTDGSAGVGSVPGESTSAPAGQSGGAGVSAAGGAPMMGGMGGGGGGEDQQRTASYPLHETGLFEADVPEGPFGIARISGSLDDDEPAL